MAPRAHPSLAAPHLTFTSTKKSSVHEIDDALHGERCGLGGRVADEALGCALIKRELELAATLPVARHKALEIGLGMHNVIGALHIEHGRHVDGLAAVHNADRIAFLHRVLTAPELEVGGDHAIDL